MMEQNKIEAEKEGVAGLVERLASRYNREQLSEQVWSQPVQAVAKFYDISGIRLGKVCHKLLMPVPPGGFWARLRNGYKVGQPVLPKLQ
jgi:hypothetical protein